jgi:hypothetical protein
VEIIVNNKFIVTILFSVILGACSTPYQANNWYAFRGGFNETQLDTNVFRVVFEGNGYTSTQKAEDLTLLRSAELTLKNQFTHFVVVNSNTDISNSSYTTPTQSTTTANVNAYGNTAYGTANTTTYGGQTINISKPSTNNTIVCFNGKPELKGLVYEAKFICKSLGEKYGEKCGAE